jgi:hypothetical protein
MTEFKTRSQLLLLLNTHKRKKKTEIEFQIRSRPFAHKFKVVLSFFYFFIYQNKIKICSPAIIILPPLTRDYYLISNFVLLSDANIMIGRSIL